MDLELVDLIENVGRCANSRATDDSAKNTFDYRV